MLPTYTEGGGREAPSTKSYFTWIVYAKDEK